MTIQNAETRKKERTIQEVLAIIGKELGFKKYYAQREINKYPSKKLRLENEVLAYEKGFEILKEISQKPFLKIDALEK